MKSSVQRAFTLVELLIVVGIIGVLISILLPALNRARESANAIKCAANLRSIGQAMMNYVTENKGIFPMSNYYKGMHFVNGQQIPSKPDNGYVHWSSYLYSDSSKLGTDEPFKSATGWDMFQCPSLEKGGLQPANTFPSNRDDGFSFNETGNENLVDWQAPRLAYTVNEAICPRGIFQKFLSDRGNLRVYRFVNLSTIRNAVGTILATELWGDPRIELAEKLSSSGNGNDGADNTVGSRRPVNGFTGGIIAAKELYKLPPNGKFKPATPNDLGSAPERGLGGGTSPTTLLDWVGRNHGGNKLNGKSFDGRTSNFLYVDGHVETKSIKETVAPFQWGEKFYSLIQ